jgi:cell division protein FtsI (penicillin-binding protein 3)
MKGKRGIQRRLTLSIVIVFAIVAVFSARLVDLQVVQGPALARQATNAMTVTVATNGARGSIVDSSGTVLADNVDLWDITAAPKQLTSIPAKGFDYTVKGVTKTMTVTAALARIASLTGRSAATLSAAITAHPNSDFAYLAQGVSASVYSAVMRLKVPGVYAQPDPARTYPNGAIAGNLVGFMGTAGAQAGIELKYNSCLSGTTGSSSYQASADGVTIPGTSITKSVAKPGGTITLTIDRDLQYEVQEAIAAQAKKLGAPWATGVVEQVSNGHLLAVADYPTVDPNNVNGASRSALGSRAFSTPYEPGSTFKAMSVASLIDAGAITPTTKITVPPVYTTGLPPGAFIKDSFTHGTLHYTTAGVLENSSNIGMSILSQSLPAQQRRAYMVKFGVGQKTAVDFPGESGGILTQTPWDPITTRAVEFGQGVEATSVQVAQIFSTIANGGVREPSTLVEGCTNSDGTVTDKPSTKAVRIVSAKAADETVGMLETVVTGGPISSLLKIPGYRIAAKTGTAQVAKSNGTGYGNDYIISVAGMVPANDPQYVAVVTFGPTLTSTSAGAAPAFKNVMTDLIKKYRIEPSTTPAPYVQTTW